MHHRIGRRGFLKLTGIEIMAANLAKARDYLQDCYAKVQRDNQRTGTSI